MHTWEFLFANRRYRIPSLRLKSSNEVPVESWRFLRML
jgi:hypothetical protein